MPRGSKAGGSENSPSMKELGMRPTVAPRTVPLAQVAPNPRNLRENDLGTSEEVAEVVTSVRELGILQALLVCTREAFLKEQPELKPEIGDAQYVLLAGHRRYEAAKLAGLDEVRIDVQDDRAPDMDLVMLEENMKRKALNVFQEGEGYRRLAAKGMSHKAIGDKVGKGKSTITKRIALLDLPDDAKEAHLEKRLSVDTAYNLLVALGDEHRHRLLEAANIMKRDRDATAVDAVNQLLAGSARTDTGTTSPPPTAAPAAAAPVLTEPTAAPEAEQDTPAEASEPAPAATATLTEDTPATVPPARTEAPETVLTEPAAEPARIESPGVTHENAGRAEASAARNDHCGHLVVQYEKPNQDPQTLRIASTVLAQATPAALKRAHTWMKQADAADAAAFDAASYRDTILVRSDSHLIPHLAYALALAEDELRASNRSRNWDYRDLAHLQHLIDSGYEPTEWERRHLG